jgi:hypothetical protein
MRGRQKDGARKWGKISFCHHLFAFKQFFKVMDNE